MRAGITSLGDAATIIPLADYIGPQDYSVCVFYGYVPMLQKVMADFRALGRPVVYIDLGYWSRKGPNGYHKIAVNDRHPTDYFQRRRHDGSRAAALGIQVKSWRPYGDGHILLAGMGRKAAVIAEGQELGAFEREAIAEIRKYSDRPIVYRPKPSCAYSGPIEGTIFSSKDQPLVQVLRGCHAVVTHHSNVAVDALVEGIPVFARKGVAAPMSAPDLSHIEDPYYPDDRRQWVNDVAWTQFSVQEMGMGLPWRHLKDEGLVP